MNNEVSKYFQLTMSLAIESQANSGKFDNFLINTKINVCRLGAGSYNFMQKYVYMVTQKYSNIKMVCPFPKNSYYLKNVEFHDSDIPPIFPDTKAQITVASSGIIVGKKRLQEIFTMQTVAQFMKG